jgi:hypothetical protein
MLWTEVSYRGFCGTRRRVPENAWARTSALQRETAVPHWYESSPYRLPATSGVGALHDCFEAGSLPTILYTASSWPPVRGMG